MYKLEVVFTDSPRNNAVIVHKTNGKLVGVITRHSKEDNFYFRTQGDDMINLDIISSAINLIKTIKD